MKNIISLLLFSLSFSQSKTTPIEFGETFTFQSKVLNEERRLNVFLPAGYDKSKSYPVIYLLDGATDEDFIHVTGLVQYMNFPWLKYLEPTILVGIANVDRRRDFTFPSKNEKDLKNAPTSGGSAKFIECIKTEIQPLIEKTYAADPEKKMLIGQSFGGLLATEILFKEPDLFTTYIIVSPSIWWGDQALKKVDHQLKDNKRPLQIYIAVGGKETAQMIDGAQFVYDQIKSIPNIKSHYEYMPPNTHGDILHQAIYDAFMWLAGK